MKDQIEKVAQWIVHSKRVVVFAGAGLSTESGIPDFRSREGCGIDTTRGLLLSELHGQRSLPGKVLADGNEMYEPMKKAQPNPAHLAIADLERLGKLDCIITQNVDGLHHKAGNSEEKILELHGTAMHVACMQCHKRYDRRRFSSGGRNGKSSRCGDCGGPLKPATISFGQSMPERRRRNLINGPPPAISLSSLVRLSLCNPPPPCRSWQNERGQTGHYQP